MEPQDRDDGETERLALLGRLAPGIAHEVNTLLGVVVTAASHFSVLRRDLGSKLGDDTLTRQDMEHYLAQSDRAERIMLTNLERAASLARSFKHVSVAHNHEDAQDLLLAGFLEEVTQSANSLLRGCRHTLAVDCPPDLQVRTAPGALASILLNLLANTARHAISSNDHGRAAVGISIRARPLEGDTWALTYADTGRGIAPDIAKRVFEPYVTTRRGRGGSGLGLSIVRSLATEVLQGQVELTSQPGQGVTFRFVFPRVLQASTGGDHA